MTTVVNLRMDKYTVYIGRGSKWGNPFVIGRDGNREIVVQKYEKYALANGLDVASKELKGEILGCYCKPALCHGDLLKGWADGA